MYISSFSPFFNFTHDLSQIEKRKGGRCLRLISRPKPDVHRANTSLSSKVIAIAVAFVAAVLVYAFSLRFVSCPSPGNHLYLPLFLHSSFWVGKSFLGLLWNNVQVGFCSSRLFFRCYQSYCRSSPATPLRSWGTIRRRPIPSVHHITIYLLHKKSVILWKCRQLI